MSKRLAHACRRPSVPTFDKKENLTTSGLFESNADFPTLIANGVCDSAMDIKFGHANVQNIKARLKLKILMLQNARAISKVFRDHIDKFILSQLDDIKDSATRAWEAKRAEVCAHNATTEDSEQKRALIKNLREKHVKSTFELNSKMEQFFPGEVCNQYAMCVNGANSTFSINYLHLHHTVSMFFAMATQRCYMHTCGGYKMCTKTHSGNCFSTVHFEDDQGVSKQCCVYSSKHCIAQLCENKNDMYAPGKMPYQTKLAVEMYRLRGVYTHDDIKSKLSPPPTTFRDGNSWATEVLCPTFVLTHPDIGINSLQKKLSITQEEIDMCKMSLERKKQQEQDLKDRIKAVHEEHLLQDVDSALKNSRDFGFDSVSQMQTVLPGLCAIIKFAISANSPATKNALDIRMVGTCLNDVKALMAVRKFGQSTGAVSSNQAYDFMTGKAGGILVEHNKTEAWASATVGVSWLRSRDRPISLATICAAMELFDKIDEKWELSIKGHDTQFEKSKATLWVPGVATPDVATPGSRLGFSINVSDVRGIMKRKEWLAAIRSVLEQETDDEFPLLPSTANIENMNPFAASTIQEIFKLLISKPKTKCLAMRLLGIDNFKLCGLVEDKACNNILRRLGITVPVD